MFYLGSQRSQFLKLFAQGYATGVRLGLMNLQESQDNLHSLRMSFFLHDTVRFFFLNVKFWGT